ncbi:MAG: hypothetical protein M1839_005146 [Geoglossum umbratile]|nr:MAG: hypothetical protein M1839_005146 [Geoglossum umbratile]
MTYEIDSFGIKATLVKPGLVRRDDLRPDSRTQPLPTWGHFLIKPPSEPYAHASSPAGQAKRTVRWLADRQPTSTVLPTELVNSPALALFWNCCVSLTTAGPTAAGPLFLPTIASSPWQLRGESDETVYGRSLKRQVINGPPSTIASSVPLGSDHG